MSAKLDRTQHKVTPASGPAGQSGIVPVAFTTSSEETKSVVYPAEDRVEITEPPDDGEDLKKRFPALDGHHTD